jgi:hypothetical protein
MVKENTHTNILLDIVIAKKWRLIRHVVLIVILAINLYPNVDANSFENLHIPNIDKMIDGFNIASFLVFIISLIIIYFNLYVLIPKFLMKNKYVLYLLYFIIIGVVYFISQLIISKIFLGDLAKYVTLVELSIKGFVDAVFIPLTFLSATAGYKIFKKWIIDSQQLAALKEARIQDELTNLKNQINPHFLFNTLNNLNTLISTDSHKASTVVLGLSDVLRYQLYETNSNTVLLRKDIEILNQYLDLEKIRRDNFQFSIEVVGDSSRVKVPPFIFINFIENAIKHSVDNTAFSYIAVLFTIEENKIKLLCKNSKPITQHYKKAGGIGLQNIKRRLELLYANEFSLQIANNEREFIVELEFPYK